MEQVKPAADAMEDVPTEFEIITALGMLYFAQQKCEIVVLEVGLGGTLDSTNVIDAPECAVITALGMDHVKELGPTLADIAAAKAGIIKEECPVVSYGGVPEADAVIRRVAAEKHAELTEVDFSRLKYEGGSLDAVEFDFDGLTDVHLPLIGSYQPRNAALAITALRVMRTHGWNIPESAIRTGLETVSWPGRFELLRHAPAFLLDGSHNAHGMRATVQSLRDRFPGQKFVFLVSIMKDLASEVYASGTGRLSITMITAVYLSSKAFISFQLGLDDMYHVKENRNFILRRIYSVLYSIVFALALIFLLGIMVFGNMLRKMYFSNVHHIIGSIIGSVVDYRLVICLPVLILFFWVIYVFLPNKKQRAKYQLPGAVFAAAAWMIFSGIFSVYVDKYNNYSSFYGTMTTIALIMVWLYGCMYVLFIGGIINRTWEERMEAKKYYK